MAAEEKVYAGIDLGTTYSSMALFTPGGTPFVEKNLDNVEDMPSAVYFDMSGEYIVGTGAKERIPEHPDSTVSFIKQNIGRNVEYEFYKRRYTAADLSAMIIEKLVSDISRVSGSPISEAVITVPAGFGDREREATVKAGKAAGLTEVELLNEPTAAAIAYGYGRRDQGRMKIMVFDMGGGTLDISILDINGDEFTAVAVDGDMHLGGRDFDRAL